MFSSVVIILTLVVLFALLCRDYVKALAFGVFICIFMSTFVRIRFGGIIPDVTIQRAVLIVLLFGLLLRTGLGHLLQSPPLRRLFAAWALVNFISLCFTEVTFATSFRRYLDLILEISAFYFVAATAVRSREDGMRVLKAVWMALFAVAILALIERWTRFNPVDSFIPDYARDDRTYRDVLSTFQHRILLGTAMAMGVPIGIALIIKKRLSAFLGWSSVIAFCAANYFAMSRGPWLSLALAMGTLWLLGGSRFRRIISLGIGLVLLGLILRPGVWETLGGFVSETKDAESFKGGTFQYRLELWKVAFTEVSTSPKRFLFGFGPGAGSELDIDWTLSYRGKEMKIESWDNHFAYDLLQSGMIGLGVTLMLFYNVLRSAWIAWKTGEPEDKEFLICIFACLISFLFMMTNVLIFSKQLFYLVWSLTAVVHTYLRALPIRDEAQEPYLSQERTLISTSSI